MADQQEIYMAQALALAREAAAAGEVPVGCVIVRQGMVIGRGRNRREEKQAVSSHAEIEAMAQANAALGSWRLDDCELYVTLEPCPMCAGAILNARIPKVYYGARDRAFGACGGVTNLFMEEFPNRPALVGGILAGFASGLVLTCGCSTGGLDILGLYLSKKGSRFTVGRFSISFNALLYTLCFFLFDAATAIYSAIYNVLSNLFLDRLHRQNVTVQLLIFTKKNDPQLPRYIMEQLDRGVTSWAAKGGWTGDDVQVLCVCLSKYEIDTLRQVMQQVDPDAFYIVQEGVHAGGNFKRHLG